MLEGQKTNELVEKGSRFISGTERKLVRARNDKGQYIGDDDSTPDINEAYEEVRVKRKPGRPKKS